MLSAFDFYSAMVQERSTAISLSVCEHISGLPLDWSSENLLCRSPVAQSSSGGIAICYVLLVLRHVWSQRAVWWCVDGSWRCDTGTESYVYERLVCYLYLSLLSVLWNYNSGWAPPKERHSLCERILLTLCLPTANVCVAAADWMFQLATLQTNLYNVRPRLSVFLRFVKQLGEAETHVLRTTWVVK